MKSNAAVRGMLHAAIVASVLALPQIVPAGDDRAARAAAASDPEYAGHMTCWSSLQKAKPMDVMHMIDVDQKGFVTKEEFMRFQEKLFDRMDREHTGKVGPEAWMGTSAGGTANK